MVILESDKYNEGNKTRQYIKRVVEDSRARSTLVMYKEPRSQKNITILETKNSSVRQNIVHIDEVDRRVRKPTEKKIRDHHINNFVALLRNLFSIWKTRTHTLRD